MWDRLIEALKPTAWLIRNEVIRGRFGEPNANELVNVGLLGVIDKELEEADVPIIKKVGARCMWDYVIREHRIVTLPKTHGARYKVSKMLAATVDIVEYNGQESFEDAYILALDLTRRLEQMGRQSRRFWLLVMQGYTIGEIARITGGNEKSISVTISRSKLVDRNKTKANGGVDVLRSSRAPRLPHWGSRRASRQLVQVGSNAA